MGESSSRVWVLGADLVDGVFVFELNRPEARNAISPDMVAALNDALSRFESDDSAKVGVITGAGPAFCAGLDLKVFAAADADAERRTVGTLLRRFGQLGKPLIGAINGPAIAGGLELALSCDFLIGSPRAVFADTHVKIGAFPGAGLTARLSRAVGVRTAKAMGLAGLRLDALAALRAGLLVEVVEPDALMTRAHELAFNIANANGALVASLRKLYDANMNRSLNDALAAEQVELERWRQASPRTWSA